MIKNIGLARRLVAIGTPRILVVGDLMLDDDLHGGFAGPAQECAACPKFVVAGEETRLGGAGAVAAMAAALGATVRLATVAGNDDEAREAERLLEAAGVDPFIVRADGHKTTVKSRWFADGRQVWRSDDEKPQAINEYLSGVLANATRGGWVYDATLIADYGKGVCTPAVLAAAIGAARERQAPCIVDPAHGADWSRYVGAAAAKCNAAEFRCARYDLLPLTIRTEGAAGMAIYKPGSSPYPFFPKRRNVLDSTGAGDMVLAALGVCVAVGWDWPDACRLANAAAGIKVERRGAVPVSRGDVLLDLLAGEKVLPADLAGPWAAAHRAAGRSVAMANGCFDGLHAGHLETLRTARRECDAVLVAVNGDESVRRLKGKGRPIQGEDDRAEVLAELACVDAVVVFHEDTPAKLAESVKPCAIVKGADWKGKTVAGAEHAGRVVFADLLGGVSTTRLAAARA